MHDTIKKAADSGDVKTLKYAFCDALDGDPTFRLYEEDLDYCRQKGVLFVPNEDMTPFDKSDVSVDKWVEFKKDFMENPSLERLAFMREYAKLFYADRILRIEQEEEEARAAKKAAEERKAAAEKAEAAEKKEVVVKAEKSAETAVSPVPKKAAVTEGHSEVRRVVEKASTAQTPAYGTKIERKKDTSSKKLLGVAIGAVLVAAIIVVFVMAR